MPGLTEPNQVGKREDLADIYAIVDEKATAFTTRVSKSAKATNSEFDWLVDKYAAHRTSATVDGEDVDTYENAAADRLRIGNYTQEWRRSAKVSRRSELSDVAGVRSEIALASAKKLVEVKRDTEATLLSSNAGQTDNGGVGYQTIGLGLWIDTTGPTVPKAITGYAPAAAQVVTTATASLTEDGVNDLLAAIFDNTGMIGDYVLFCGSVLRARLTEMTRLETSGSTSTRSVVRTWSGNINSTVVTHSTTMYHGDFGSFEVVPSSFIGGDTVDTDRGYLIDMDKVHLRMQVMPKVERFEDRGGGPRLLVSCIGGLQVDNPIGLGKFQP